MAKITTLGITLAILLVLFIAGCTETQTSTRAPAGCGDGFCGVGEDTTNCPLDCGGSTGGSRPSSSRPSSGRMDTPELEVEIDDTGISEIPPGGQALIVVRIKNLADQSFDELENQRLTIRNVRVLLYDFGDFYGCTPAEFYFDTLGPEEEREVGCTVTAPNKEIEQTVRVRTFYTYDLYASLDNIHVYSQEEYAAERPETDVEEVTVDGPLGMTITASKIPVKAGSPVSVAIELEAESSKRGGVLKKRDVTDYHVKLLQVQVPEGFIIGHPGTFDQSGSTLTDSYLALFGDTRKFTFYITAPDILTPRETFSLSAIATGFEIFVDNDLELIVQGFD